MIKSKLHPSSSTLHLIIALLVLLPIQLSAQIHPRTRLPLRNHSLILSPYSVQTAVIGNNVNASNLSGPQSECFITIDPSNPARILAGSNDISGPTMRAYYSSNSAATFSGSSPSRTVSGFTFGFCSDPGLGFDLNGNAFYSYLVIANDQTRGGLVVAKSTTGGANWITPAVVSIFTTLSAATVFDDKSLMTVDTNTSSPYKNNIYVVWDRIYTSDAHVLFSKSTNSGTSYIAPVRLDDSTSSSGGVIYADPAVGPNGEIYVIWNDYGFTFGNDKLVVDKSTDGGVTWGPDHNVESHLKLDVFDGNTGYFVPSQPDRGIAATPSIDVDRSTSARRGWVYTTWCDRSTVQDDIRIYFSRSTDGGVNWSPKTQVNDDTTTRTKFFPWMSVDPTDGNIHIMWYDCRDDSNNKKVNVYYSRSTDGGFTFDKNTSVSSVQSDESVDNGNRDSGNNYGDYEGIVAFGGVAYPVWTDTRNSGTEEVYVARVTNTPDEQVAIIDWSLYSNKTKKSD